MLAEASHGQSGRRLLAESKPAPIRIVPVRKQTENFSRTNLEVALSSQPTIACLVFSSPASEVSTELKSRELSLELRKKARLSGKITDIQ